MKLTFLRPLYAQGGPFACAYVDTSRDIEDPDRAIELRWRHLRQDLQTQGTDTATTEALAQVVGTDSDVPGPHGQAVFAAHGRVVLAEELPAPPVRDSARYAMLPDAMPLAVQHAPDIAYVAVAMRWLPGTDREAEQQELEVEVQAGHWPTTRLVGGDRALRRMPAARWRHEAAQIAAQLTALVERGAAEVIVISSDTWARGVLSHQLPERLRDRIIGVDEREATAPGRALLEDDLSRLFQGRLTAHDRARVEMFLARRAAHRGAAEGLMPVVEALRRGQAEALLINDTVDLSMRLWVGDAPKQIGLSEQELRAYGVQPCWQEPADTALIRAVVGTGAELVVVPAQQLPLAEGVGALLRYAEAGT